MIYLAWILLLPFDVIVKIIGLVFAPVFSLFVDEEGDLPLYLLLFQTPDSNMFGYDGDMGFYEDHKHQLDTFLGRWWVCTLWQWRNTSQGFSTFTLGVYDSNLLIETKWELGEGKLYKYFKTASLDGRTKAWEFKGAFQWFNLNKRFRWRLGWKLQWDEDLPAQYVFSISPFTTMN